MSSISNLHKVDKSQWKKWDNASRLLFNNVYEDIKRVGPDLFLHPDTEKRNISAEEFDTIAWNAAWTAANYGVPTEQISVIDPETGFIVSDHYFSGR